jgi:hypothetical protein
MAKTKLFTDLKIAFEATLRPNFYACNTSAMLALVPKRCLFFLLKEMLVFTTTFKAFFKM